MSSATASGADAGSGGARHREHRQGNQDRKATPEQMEAVTRIRRCQATAFYDILGIESVRATCTEAEIKKAYRKQSLLTHPDKNGHQHADEAFKMVSRAFSILGDKDKKGAYDRSGVDPDSRFASANAARGRGGGAGGPFPGFPQTRDFGGGQWEEEISPEEIFNRFFGGAGGFGGGGMGGPFGGPQFVFNMGGGPNVRVHQFGGPRPRARPRNPGQQEPESSLLDMIIQLLPIIILFLLPVIFNLFGSLFEPTPVQPTMPNMVFDQAEPETGFTAQRTTPGLGIDYYVRAEDVSTYSSHKLYEMDRHAELMILRNLKMQCEAEQMHKQKLSEEAQGWFFQDPEKMDLAVRYETPHCQRLDHLTNIARNQ